MVKLQWFVRSCTVHSFRVSFLWSISSFFVRFVCVFRSFRLRLVCIVSLYDPGSVTYFWQIRVYRFSKFCFFVVHWRSLGCFALFRQVVVSTTFSVFIIYSINNDINIKSCWDRNKNTLLIRYNRTWKVHIKSIFLDIFNTLDPIFNKTFSSLAWKSWKKWGKYCFWKTKVVRGIHVFQYKNFALILKHFCRRNSLCLGVKLPY